ncbi:hypothetical protein BJD99_00425 [Rhodococcus sp. 1163]|nr:hypothetical protein BJD99_00425 [Rhodococcus sp. 1163]
MVAGFLSPDDAGKSTTMRMMVGGCVQNPLSKSLSQVYGRSERHPEVSRRRGPRVGRTQRVARKEVDGFSLGTFYQPGLVAVLLGDLEGSTN